MGHLGVHPLTRLVLAFAVVAVSLSAASAADGYTYPRFQPVSVAFLDKQHGVLAEDDWKCQKPDGCQGRILVTSDGGAHWRVTHQGPRGTSLYPVRGTRVVYAVTGTVMIESTDAGLHWQRAAMAPVTVSFVTAMHGWRIGFTLKAVLRRPPPIEETRDGGRSWTARVNPCPPPDYGQVAALSFATATRGWAVCATQATAGYQGKEVWQTDDGGRHWHLRGRTHPIAPPEPKLQVGNITGYGYPTGATFLPDGHGWLLQGRGFMLTTLDGGHTWTPSHITKPDTIAAASADLLTDKVGFVLLRGCTVRLVRTTDAGKHWTTLDRWNSPNRLLTLEMTASNVARAVAFCLAAMTAALAACTVASGVVTATVASAITSTQAGTSVPICQSQHLRLRASFYGEAGGQFIQTFTATNAGATLCRLAGWPTLGLRDASGQTQAAPSIRVVQGRPSSQPFGTVTLQPGGAATFDVFGADFNAVANRACPQTHALLVALPGVAPMPVTVAIPNCGAFYVAPLIAGKSDRNAWSTVWAKRWCRIQQFAMTIGPPISEATGQHTLALRLTNHGSSCTLYGFPSLWFEDVHGRIPFQLRTGGDQMIATTTALPVQVVTGGSAWVVINHYRCDLGNKRAASTIRIGLSGAAYTNTAHVAIPNPYEHVAYCGKGDPGSTITVAPFEPTLVAAFRR